MSFRNIFGSFSLYTIVTVFGSAAGFILMPFLTHYLSPSDYGQLALFNTYVQLIIPLISISAFGLVTIEYFNKNVGHTQFKSIFSSISLVPIPGFVIFSLVAILFDKWFSVWLKITPTAVLFIPVFALLSIAFNQFQSYLVALKRSKLFAFVNISKTVVEYSLVVLFVIGLERGWFGRVEAAIVVFFALALLSLYFYKKWDLLTSKVTWQHFYAGIIYGFPLIAHVIGKFVINQSDKVFISQMVSSSELGIYNTGYLLGSIIMILGGAFINVFTPYIYERMAEITYTKKMEIVRMAYVFLFALAIVLIALSVLSPYLYAWFIDPKYAGGVVYVFWTGLSYFFWGVYLVFSALLFFLKKTKILGFLAIVNVGLNLGLNYLLIKQFGTIGASYATCISFFVVMIVVVYASSKIYPMPWLDSKVFRLN